MENLIQKIYNGVLEGNQSLVQEKVSVALKSDFETSVILNDGMIAAMEEVGHRFEIGEFFVPEMLVAARAMQGGLSILKPFLKQGEYMPAGKVIIGTVKGDLHDIGKNLVAIMLEGAGFEIVDVGTDVPPEKFVSAILENKADILGLSALLTTTMVQMKTTITAIETAGLRSKVKVIIGGAPVTEEYAEQIGADGYAPDASKAVSLVKSLL